MAPGDGGNPNPPDKPGTFDFQKFDHNLEALKDAAKTAKDEGRDWEYVLVTYKEKK